MFGSVMSWIGGGINRTAAAGLVMGVFFLVFGMLPWEFVVGLITQPPDWLLNGWVRLGAIIIGLALIFISLRLNVWSRRQGAIDELAQELSWAISNLLNRKPTPTTEAEVTQWAADFDVWCNKVTGLLENRAFFTLADQLHFDRLGFVDQVTMSGQQKMDWWFSLLKLKFERLRDVINWIQTRGR